MKKSFFILAVFALVASASSCKKTYSCTCTNSTAAGGATAVYEIPNATSQEAQAICIANEVYVQGNTQQTTCTLNK